MKIWCHGNVSRGRNGRVAVSDGAKYRKDSATLPQFAKYGRCDLGSLHNCDIVEQTREGSTFEISPFNTLVRQKHLHHCLSGPLSRALNHLQDQSISRSSSPTPPRMMPAQPVCPNITSKTPTSQGQPFTEHNCPCRISRSIRAHKSTPRGSTPSCTHSGPWYSVSSRTSSNSTRRLEARKDIAGSWDTREAWCPKGRDTPASLPCSPYIG